MKSWQQCCIFLPELELTTSHAGRACGVLNCDATLMGIQCQMEISKHKEFGTFTELKITGTFSWHKDIHKYMWASRGDKSIVHYIILNRKLTTQVMDTIVF
jgi:hypothetical protein